MLAGDIRCLEQLQNDIISADDARQGWSCEVGEEGIVNMPFLQVPALNAGDSFSENSWTFQTFCRQSND